MIVHKTKFLMFQDSGLSFGMVLVIFVFGHSDNHELYVYISMPFTNKETIWESLESKDKYIVYDHFEMTVRYTNGMLSGQLVMGVRNLSGEVWLEK